MRIKDVIAEEAGVLRIVSEVRLMFALKEYLMKKS